MKEETEIFLLSNAKSCGYEVSHSQLKRWCREGLLPRPRQIHLGRHGSSSIYPIGTSKQLIELCSIQDNYRQLELVAWELWWRGYNININIIRSFIRSVAEKIETSKSQLKVSRSGLIEKSAYYRFENKNIRGMRKKIGRKLFPDLTEILILIATGNYDQEAWKAEVDQMLFEKAFGIQSARVDKIGDNPAWLKGESINDLSKLVARLNYIQMLDVLSDHELVQAKNEIQAFFDYIEKCSLLSSVFNSDSRFGFHQYLKLIETIDQREIASFIITWEFLKRNGCGEAIKSILILGENLPDKSLLQIDIFKLLSDEIPEIAPLITLKRRKAASRTEKSHRKYIEQLNQLYIQHKHKFDAFWKKHPEYMSI